MGSLCSQNRIVVHSASTNLRSVSRSRFWLASNLPATRPDWLAAKCRDPGTRARSTHPRRRRGAAGGRRDPRADALLEVAVGSRRGIGVRDDGVTNAGRAHLAYPAAGWSAFVWLRPERMAKEIGPSPSTLIWITTLVQNSLWHATEPACPPRRIGWAYCDTVFDIFLALACRQHPSSGPVERP